MPRQRRRSPTNPAAETLNPAIRARVLALIATQLDDQHHPPGSKTPAFSWKEEDGEVKRNSEQKPFGLKRDRKLGVQVGAVAW